MYKESIEEFILNFLYAFIILSLNSFSYEPSEIFKHLIKRFKTSFTLNSNTFSFKKIFLLL